MWQQQLLTFLRNFNLSNLQAALGGTIFRFYAETRHQTILRRFLLQLLIWNELDLDGSGTRNVRIKITPTLPPTGLTVDIESMGVPLSDVSLTLFIGLNNDVWPAGGAPAQMDFAFVSYIGQAGEAMPGQLTIFFEQKTVGGHKFLLARLATPSAPNPLHMRAGTFTSPVTVQPAKQSLPFGGELDVKIRTGNLLTATNMVDADLVLRSSTPGQLHLQLPMEVEFTSNTGGASHIHVSYNAPASLDIGVEVRTRGPGVGLSQASIKGMPKAVSLSYQEAPAVGTPNITYSAPNAVIPEIVVFSQSEDSSTTPPTFSYLDARVSDIPPAVKVFLGSGAIRLVTESAIGGTGVIGRIRVERSTTDGAPIPSIGEQAIYHDMLNMVTVANMRDIVAASFETQAAPPGFTTPTIGVLNYESTQRYSLGLLVKTGVDTEVRANLEFLPKSLTVRTDFINVVEWTATDAISTLSAELWNWTMHSSGARRRTITFVSADNLPARFRLNRYGTQQVQWGSPFDRLNRVQVRHFIDVPNWAEAGIQPPPVPVRPITIECVASGLPSQFTLSEIATIAPGPRVVDYEANETWDELLVTVDELTLGNTPYNYGKLLLAKLPTALQASWLINDPYRLLFGVRCSLQPGDPLQMIGGIHAVLADRPVVFNPPVNAVDAVFTDTVDLKQIKVGIWGLQHLRFAQREAGVHATSVDGVKVTFALANAGDFGGRDGYNPPATRSLQALYQSQQRSITATAVGLPSRFTLDTDLKSAARIEGAIDRAKVVFSGKPPPPLDTETKQLQGGLNIRQTPAWIEIIAARTSAGGIQTVNYSAASSISAHLQMHSMYFIVKGMKQIEIDAGLPPGMTVDLAGKQFSTSNGSLTASIAAHQSEYVNLPESIAENGARVLVVPVNTGTSTGSGPVHPFTPQGLSYPLVFRLSFLQGQYEVRSIHANIRALASVGIGSSLGPGTYELAFGAEQLPTDSLRFELSRPAASVNASQLIYFELNENLPHSISVRKAADAAGMSTYQLGLSSVVRASQTGERVGRAFVLLEPDYREIVPGFIDTTIQQAGTGLIQLNIHCLPRYVGISPTTVVEPGTLDASTAILGTPAFTFWTLPADFTAQRIQLDGSDELELRDVRAVWYIADYRGDAYWARILAPRIDYHQQLLTGPHPRTDPIILWLPSENESTQKNPEELGAGIAFEAHENILLNLDLLRAIGVIPRPRSFNAFAENYDFGLKAIIQLACFYGLAFVVSTGDLPTTKDCVDQGCTNPGKQSRQWRVVAVDAILGVFDYTVGNTNGPVVFQSPCQ